jgi:hypothetical protein
MGIQLNTLATMWARPYSEVYAGGDRSSYDYCVWTLRRDNKSATADELGLAVIAARMARPYIKTKTNL